MIKKVILLGAVLAVTVLVTGCVQSSTQSASNSSGGAGVTGGMTASVTKVTVSQNIASNLRAGYKYVGFNCTVKNVNADDRAVAYNFWTLRDTQGGVYNPVYLSSATGQFGGTMSQPGDTISGVVVFEVPQNAQLKSLTYSDGIAKIVTTL